MRENPGSYALVNDAGTDWALSVGDQVALVRPKPDADEVARRSAEEVAEYMRGLQGSSDVHPSVPRFDRDKVEKVGTGASEREHWNNIKMGVIGPTSHMNYSEILNTKAGKEKILKEEEKSRNGSQHYSASQKERVYARQQDRMEQGAAAVERAKAGTNFPHGSIPANVRPKNQMPPAQSAALRSGR